MIEIRKRGEKAILKFKTEDAAGAWLRKQNWPATLAYAPDADRLQLAEHLRGSPWIVKRT